MFNALIILRLSSLFKSKEHSLIELRKFDFLEVRHRLSGVLHGSEKNLLKIFAFV